MPGKVNSRNILKRIINFITFVDLPIKKKFLLFAVGVLFWFVVMYVMSIATIVDINSSSTQIVNKVIPQDRIAQKITRKIQSLDNDAAEIGSARDGKTIQQQVSTSRSRIEDIKSILSVLMIGGQVSDIRRESGELIESFSVSAVMDDVDGGKYVRLCVNS